MELSSIRMGDFNTFTTGFTTCFCVMSIVTFLLYRRLKPVQLKKKVTEDADVALIRNILSTCDIEPEVAEELNRQIERAEGNVGDQVWSQVEENINSILEEEKKKKIIGSLLLRRRTDILTWINQKIRSLHEYRIETTFRLNWTLNRYNILKAKIDFYLRRRYAPFYRVPEHEQGLRNVFTQFAAFKLIVNRLTVNMVTTLRRIASMLNPNKLKTMEVEELEKLEEEVTNAVKSTSYYWLRSVEKSQRQRIEMEKNLNECVQEQNAIIRANGLRQSNLGLVNGF
ncbi:unnamed protein product [Orchesella dallaii]|uniref:Uncharacterized protein n=1 Tax=Orchesella dallaii TaxID=48710 RepID=A0ABP1RT16_9HEXA